MRELKGELSGYPVLSPDLIPSSEFYPVSLIHFSLCRAVRGLVGKELIRVSGRGSKKRLLLDYRNLAIEFIRRTGFGRALSKQG